MDLGAASGEVTHSLSKVISGFKQETTPIMRLSSRSNPWLNKAPAPPTRLVR